MVRMARSIMVRTARSIMVRYALDDTTLDDTTLGTPPPHPAVIIHAGTVYRSPKSVVGLNKGPRSR